MNNLTCGIYLYDIIRSVFLIGHVTGLEIYSIPKGEPDLIDNNNLETAIRELREETGLIFNELGIIQSVEFETIKFPDKDRYLKPFLITFAPEELPKTFCDSYFTKSDGTKLPEIDDFKWIKISEAKEHLPLVQLHYLPKIKEIINTPFLL